MIQFNWSVLRESEISEEVQVNLKGHCVKKVSVRDGRLSLGLCRFNAASLHRNLSQLTKVMSHCLERNSVNAFTSIKRWIGISYQSWEAHTLSYEWLDMSGLTRVITLMMMSSIFWTNNRTYLNLEMCKRLYTSAFAI